MANLKSLPAALDLVRHGGDLRRASAAYAADESRWIDFSSSVNCYGINQSSLDGIWNGVRARIRNYPDPEYVALRKSIANRHGLSFENIWPFNGSAEAILSVVSEGGDAPYLIPAPSFREYARAALLFERRISEPLLWGRGPIDLGRFIQLIPEKGRVIVGYPNSPTGEAFSYADMIRIIEACSERGALLVVDEAFQPFLDQIEFPSLIQEVPARDNLVVIRSLTKSHGLAGVRLGYIVSEKETASRFSRRVPAWSVNAFAEAIGIRLSEFDDEIDHQLQEIAVEQRTVAESLSRIPGLHIVPSRCNFFLCEINDASSTASELQDKLAERCILIRQCEDYPGLGTAHFRVAVRRPHENVLLQKALKESLQL